MNVWSAIVSWFCVRPTSKRWFLKVFQWLWNMIHLIPCRNPCRLYIHLAFTYSLRWSLKHRVMQTWTGSAFSTNEMATSHIHTFSLLCVCNSQLPFPPMRVRTCNCHGLSVSCVKWPQLWLLQVVWKEWSLVGRYHCFHPAKCHHLSPTTRKYSVEMNNVHILIV